MGKLIIWNVMSLDGAFEGATPWDLSMHESVWGPELKKLSDEQLSEAAVLLFGRKTYEGMRDYWSTSTEDEAPAMNSTPKAVVSSTLNSADWNNSRLLRSLDEVAALKRDAGEKSVFVFGSAELTSSLREAGLIDEYRICVAPLLLGKTGGAPLFKPGDERQRLELIKAEPIAGGGILLFYRPIS
jgi:dihydrofolate reductase